MSLVSSPRRSSGPAVGLGFVSADSYVVLPRSSTPPPNDNVSGTATTSPSVYSLESPHRANRIARQSDSDERILAERTRLRAQATAHRWAQVLDTGLGDRGLLEDGGLGSPFALSEETFDLRQPDDADVATESEQTPPAKWSPGHGDVCVFIDCARVPRHMLTRCL
jgi:hypothetical protein